MGIDLGNDYKPEKETNESPSLQKKGTFGSFRRTSTVRSNGANSENASPGP